MKAYKYKFLIISLLTFTCLSLFKVSYANTFTFSKILSLPLIFIILGIILLTIAVILFIKERKKIKPERTPAYYGGSVAADKPIVGYKHPCRYCGKLILPNANICPFCGKESPTGPLRCPKCHNPIQKDWQTCSHCGLGLNINCPHCDSPTFFSDYCENCEKRLMVICPSCQTEQPPLSTNCVKCNKPLKKSN